MKKGKLILLKIFLLIVLLFFPGINAHTNPDMHPAYIEISHDTDNPDSKLTQDNDLSDEDQIVRNNNSSLTEQFECKEYKSIPQPLLNILSSSVWQPPKVF